MLTLGIDPGLGGALALYDTASGDVRVWDVPTHTVRRGKTDKRRLDAVGLAGLVRAIASLDVSVALIEDVGGMPGQSAPAAFTFGHVAGALEMCLLSHGVSVRKISPRAWKAALGVRGDKDDSRAKASELLPAFAHRWARKKDDGRAEAALLAYVAAHCMGAK